MSEIERKARELLAAASPGERTMDAEKKARELLAEVTGARIETINDFADDAEDGVTVTVPDALRAIIRALEQRDGWRPIEGAPRDGLTEDDVYFLVGHGAIVRHENAEVADSVFAIAAKIADGIGPELAERVRMLLPAAPKPEGIGHG